MILRGLSLRNWRNIGSLELEDLDHPLVVLHGPNRTGKSSVVAAIRSCLYDLHNSGGATIATAIPWHSKKTPEVTVEFECGGCRYRLLKKFSKRADGEAVLERSVNGAGWSVLQRGREADREVHTILGAEKWDHGINQLLWPTQGTVQLPPSGKLNDGLQRQLQEVLGSLLTASDWDFQKLLEEQSRKWFTASLGDKRGSPVADLKQRQAECQAKVEELRRSLAQAERLVQEHESLLAQAKEDRRLAAESEREVAELQQEQQAMQSRLRDHDAARHNLDAAKKDHEQACRVLSEFEARRQALVELRKKLAVSELDLTTSEETRTRLAAELEGAEERHRAARAAVEQHERTWAELGDCRKLVEIARERERLATLLEQYAALFERGAELKREWGTIAAPDNGQLGTLRENRKRAGQLKAQLEAGALRLEIDPAAAASLTLAIDTGAESTVELTPGRREVRQLRQRAELTLPGVGTIRVTRGREDSSLDDAARELERLDREYADALRAYGLAPEHDGALDELLQRQMRRQGLTQQMKSHAEELKKMAPGGREALAAELEKLDRQRGAITERCPDLVQWAPDGGEVERRQREYDDSLKRLRAEQQQAEARVTQLRSQREQAEREVQRLQVAVGALRAESRSAEEELGRMGDEVSLKEVCRREEGRLREAEARLRATQLTEHERSVEERLRGARTALQRRVERLAEHENRVHAVKGELRGMDGLHEKLAAAEAELTDIATKLEHEQVDAEAHRLLRNLFDECRDRHVQRTTGRIESQVMTWAERLGLDGYTRLEFGKGYLPEGLHRPEADAAVALEDESFGTLEQLTLLIRLAAGRLVAAGERCLTILDDPLTHSDSRKHRRMLEILQEAAQGGKGNGDGASASPLQILVFTCHPERFDHLHAAKLVSLAELIKRD